MANRVLLGEHATYDYGLFISKPSVDVTGANKNYFLFDTTGASMGQIFVFKLETLGSSASVTRSYNNFGRNTFGLLYDSQGTDRYGITLSAALAGLSLTISKTNTTTSQYVLANTNGFTIRAAIIIFAENV